MISIFAINILYYYNNYICSIYIAISKSVTAVTLSQVYRSVIGVIECDNCVPLMPGMD